MFFQCNTSISNSSDNISQVRFVENYIKLPSYTFSEQRGIFPGGLVPVVEAVGPGGAFDKLILAGALAVLY